MTTAELCEKYKSDSAALFDALFDNPRDNALREVERINKARSRYIVVESVANGQKILTAWLRGGKEQSPPIELSESEIAAAIDYGRVKNRVVKYIGG